MKIEEAIYDVLEILKATTDDTDTTESFVLSRLNKYRADFISQQVDSYGMIDMSWLQNLPLFTTTKTDSADDPAVTLASVTLGRITIPGIIQLKDDKGIWRITTASGQFPYAPIDPIQLFMMIKLKNDILKDYGYYYRIGNNIYTYPYNDVVKTTLILENPMDGKVLLLGAWRDRTLQDDWYTDNATANKCILAVLMNDFGLSNQQIADITNDAQDESKLHIYQSKR